MRGGEADNQVGGKGNQQQIDAAHQRQKRPHMGDFVIFGGGNQGAENGERQRQHGNAGAHHRERGALFRRAKAALG